MYIFRIFFVALLVFLQNRPSTSQIQQNEANYLCSFKAGIVNWATACTGCVGWDCSGTSATSFPCGPNSVSWTGIRCTPNGTVMQLSLTSKGLSGTISPSLSNLKSLSTVSLNGNKLYGEIIFALCIRFLVMFCNLMFI